MASARAAAAAVAAAAGDAAARGGGGPQEAIGPSRCWNITVGVVGTGHVCLMGQAQMSHGIQTGRKQQNPTITLKPHVSVCT